MRLKILAAFLALFALAAFQAAPKATDWTQVASATPEGGFVVGNPNAPTKLVEFVSMSCPHCAHFDANAHDALMNDYVKSGRVSYEIRNYVRDPADMAAALVARCSGPKHFFPLTHDLLAAQKEWVASLMAVPEEQQKSLEGRPPEEVFVNFAKWANLQRWAAAHGLTEAQTNACLKDHEAVQRLIRMSSEATEAYPAMTGVPSVVVNGSLLTGGVGWAELEAELKKAP